MTFASVPSRLRLRLRLPGLLLACVSVLLVGPAGAWAHARVERVSPPDGALVARQPASVAFSFGRSAR